MAPALAEAGAEVVVNYSSSAAAAEEVVLSIQAKGGTAYALQANVAIEADVDRLIKTVLERGGRLDVLVNNAGITRDGLMMRMKTNDWQAVIDLNLTGVFLCSRAVARPMLKQKSGRIINITSVVGLIGNAGQANYAAAKAGVIGLTRTTAIELARRGITVNAVAPGFFATDMTKDLMRTSFSVIFPGRFWTQEQVAGVVRFLAADPLLHQGQVIQLRWDGDGLSNKSRPTIAERLRQLFRKRRIRCKRHRRLRAVAVKKILSGT